MDNSKNPTKSRFRVPKTNPVHFPKKELLIDPYTLGVILGDGCITRSEVVISNPEMEIYDKLVESSGYDVSLRTTKNRCKSYNLLKATLDIKKLGLFGSNSFTKFIPKEYIHSDVEQRLALLRGLLDTDGYVNGASAEYYSRSIDLALGVKEIVLSLGGFAILRTKQVIGKPAYTVNISFDEDRFINVFSLSIKADKFRARSRISAGGKAIKSIEYVGEEEVQCISVSNPDHLYITDEYIVTHNTWILLRMACWLDIWQIMNGIVRNILIVSGEMDAEELEERLDSIRCGISYNRLSKGALNPKEERAYKRFMSGFNSNIKIVDTFDNLADIEHFTVVYQPSACFIDGSHLLSSSYEWTDIAKVTKTMKNMTRNRKFPIINTTHLKADKGKTANGGNIDDFAYTKGYTRDSDIVGVMYASDMMTLNQQFGIDWVKVRRANRTQLIYQNDYENSSATLVSSATGQQLSLGQNKKDNRPPSDGSGNTRNGGQVSEMYNP